MKKRYHIDGSIYFITSVVYNRLKIFTQPSFVIPIIDSLNYYRYQYSCKIIGFVYVAFKKIAPKENIGFDLSAEYQAALKLFEKKN